jgi:SNF2 family DNA or RNA helicase
MLTGKEYHDVETRPTFPNAVNLHQKLSLLSVREKREYVNVKIHFSEVEAPKPTATTIRELKQSPLLIEKLLTEARIPEIVKHIDGQTIIYTEYVTDIIEKLVEAVKNAGYSYTLFTGAMKDLQAFKDGKAQVLIASRPVSVGVDELQYDCNRLIFNTLPWTHAQYEQLIGRLDRIGQDKDVDVFVIKASIGGRDNIPTNEGRAAKMD